MKIYQNTEEKHIVKKLVFIKCDICGLGINPVVETKEGQKFDQVTVSHVKGYEYNGYGEYFDGKLYLDLDICGECFESKILPVLKSLGVDTEYRDVFEKHCDLMGIDYNENDTGKIPPGKDSRTEL